MLNANIFLDQSDCYITMFFTSEMTDHTFLHYNNIQIFDWQNKYFPNYWLGFKIDDLKIHNIIETDW